jgi:hypothetical protein
MRRRGVRISLRSYMDYMSYTSYTSYMGCMGCMSYREGLSNYLI